MARLQMDGVANAVKDAAYVSVGLGVIAFQRLQVRRNELGKVLGDQAKVVEERIGALLDRTSR